jgi:hypothetical protein
LVDFNEAMLKETTSKSASRTRRGRKTATKKEVAPAAEDISTDTAE